MTPEEKSLLERTYKLIEESHAMITKIRRTTRLSFGLKVAYWVVIVLVGFGAFYFIQPYVEAITGATGLGDLLQ
jgi:hypothetical protein